MHHDDINRVMWTLTACRLNMLLVAHKNFASKLGNWVNLNTWGFNPPQPPSTPFIQSVIEVLESTNFQCLVEDPVFMVLSAQYQC